ncbi:hypothetical protein GSI_00239 [Ganoderma sinense ZZ0214-1]|uniref:Uncharacterized protein n=1 Tax=Ganoderma sinense ZZ0214-1 TaxID=1077348 RepID=A0A2G8SS14_9APHY|nr:hypothetical protein GSI_00239 [Ganoderma sinense ZZ0214-1]
MPQAHEAYPDIPIPGAKKVHIPNRDPRLPTFWHIDHHPSIPAGWTSPPVSSPIGYLVLPPYWYIFACDVNGSQDPLHDILQLWVISRESMAPWVVEKFCRVRDTNLGPRDKCTPNKPSKTHGKFSQDGVHYERSPLANSLEKNDHVYPLTMSYEQVRKLSGLCVGTKFKDEASVHNKLRAETVSAAAEVAMCSLDVTPPEFKEHLDEQASLLNVLAVGCLPSLLVKQLSRVGGKHFDGHDAAGGITSMITDSDIDPETEDWSWFVVCDLGVAIKLREFIVVNFCGLRYHGGYAPTAKSGFAPKPWSHHFTVVCYPSAPILEGTSRLAYGVLPNNNEFPLPPEMILPRDDDDSIRVNHATWLHEGALLTPAVMFLQWFFQSVVQILYYFVRQIPAHLDVCIDHMAECFSARDPNDPMHRITAHPWKHRSDARELHDQAEQRYEAFASLQRKFVPKGVLMKLGQEARRCAKSLALLGTWESNTSSSGKATTKVASASHKCKSSKKARHAPKRRRLRMEATTVLDVHCGMQMSHVEISPLTNTESGSSDNNGEWVDMDPNDLDYKDKVPINVDVFGAGPSLRGHPDDNVDDDPMDMDVNASSSAPHRYKLRKRKC